MSIVNITEAFNRSGAPQCQRATMDLEGERREIQVFRFYIAGRDAPIEVRFVGNPIPEEIAALARAQL